MKPVESLFHIHSFGYAAENKELDSMLLEVYPVETIAYTDGEIASFKDKVTSDGEDADGNKYTTEALVGNTIKAVWIPFGSNRVTAPDVRRGERLLLWRYGDVDHYYWSTCGLDDVLRRLETVFYAWSNTRDESVKLLDETNTYYFHISTHLKLVTFHTAKNDSEPFAYTIQLNTKEGVLTISDDIGNYIQLDSGDKRITLENADGTTHVLDKLLIHSYAKESITHTTDGDYIVNCKTSVQTASASSTIKTPITTIDGKSKTTGAAEWDGAMTNQGHVVGALHNHITGIPGTPTGPVNT
jgi:hypothetical protein